MSAPRTLYITLQYLRTVSGQNKYHWGLFATGDSPPEGHLFHATDTGRKALDLLYEHRNVRNPLRSESMIVCLKIGDAPSPKAIGECVNRVPLMSRSRLPAGEPQWTCRVWVKEALNALHQYRVMNLPMGVNSIERACLAAADLYLPRRAIDKRPDVHDDLRWTSSTASRTVPMEVNSGRYYPSEMELDSSGRFRSSRSYASQMEIDSSGRYGSSKYYGSSMDIDSSAGHRLY